MTMGAFPSGQWGQTVNLLLNASVVRIHQLPPKSCGKNVSQLFLLYTFAAGHVVEQGSHAQLLAAGGEYSRLYNAQRALEQYGQKGE